MVTKVTKVTQAQLTNIQAALVSLLTSAGGMAVGFGLLTGSKEKAYASVAGIVIGLGVQIVTALERAGISKAS
jgi:hypothetical protein